MLIHLCFQSAHLNENHITRRDEYNNNEIDFNYNKLLVVKHLKRIIQINKGG